MIRHLPNLLTCCNLLCGCLGILNLFDIGSDPIFNITASPIMSTAYFVWAACVFDFLDGFAARALKISSPIGKELDSLADMVSFGLLPALFMYSLIGNVQHVWAAGKHLHMIALMIAVFSALRLAIFNLDESQKDSFRGLPTPANALFITALPFLDFTFARYIFSPWGLIAITILFSFLLVSRIELFALKFKNFAWSENKVRFTFLLLAVLLLATLQLAAIPVIIVLYIVLSLGIKLFGGLATR